MVTRVSQTRATVPLEEGLSRTIDWYRERG